MNLHFTTESVQMNIWINLCSCMETKCMLLRNARVYVLFLLKWVSRRSPADRFQDKYPHMLTISAQISSVSIPLTCALLSLRKGCPWGHWRYLCLVQGEQGVPGNPVPPTQPLPGEGQVWDNKYSVSLAPDGTVASTVSRGPPSPPLPPVGLSES